MVVGMKKDLVSGHIWEEVVIVINNNSKNHRLAFVGCTFCLSLP